MQFNNYWFLFSEEKIPCYSLCDCEYITTQLLFQSGSKGFFLGDTVSKIVGWKPRLFPAFFFVDGVERYCKMIVGIINLFLSS